ncbi:LamG-like jellyroll fold domain-containing protein [Candidatus Mancarchaeum acidiphilum]|nr:LamG-like jellyroll fold domain-containing protein [Candidatus Mancarchaeum acidiphilum]
MKSQSAMEYLMTYGWAILVIAVVLAALYSLGIFNPSSFAPKASAGSCEVVRPFGPTTSTDVHLEGTCTNMLPKYVASLNGNDGYVYSNISSLPEGKQPRTVIVWFYLTAEPSTSNGQSAIFAYGTANTCDETFWVSATTPSSTCDNSELFIDNWCTCQSFPDVPTISLDRWYFVADEYNGTYQIGYLSDNGSIISINSQQLGVNTGESPFYIGYWTVRGYFPGMIANLQIYNKSLSSNQISALYDEGIGGDPIDLTHLVAWYPLNGNAQDYSGNNYNGKAFNVSYSSTWYRTYSAP